MLNAFRYKNDVDEINEVIDFGHSTDDEENSSAEAIGNDGPSFHLLQVDTRNDDSV